MTEAARISVGISTLDRPEALARCLDALLQGDMLPAEVLVIDQGLPEKAASVVSAYGSGLAVIHVPQPRRGLSASRNEMVRRASHSILAVTDDDCVPDRSWLAAISRAFDTPPFPDAVTGRVLPLGSDEPGLHAVSLRTSITRTDFTTETAPWLVGTGANFAARRDLLIELGGYDERLGAGSPGHAAEDLELSHRLLRAGARIRYEPDAVVYHERQTLARRMSTRWSYGFGIGATCGMLWRRHDSHARAFLASWSRDVVARLVKSAVKRDTGGLRQAALSMTGTVRGWWYGWRIERPGSGAPFRRASSRGAAAVQ